MWFSIGSALAAVISIAGAWRAWRYWRATADVVAALKRSPALGTPSSDARVSSLETAVNDLVDAVERLQKADRMRKVRAGVRVHGEPDPVTQPAEWKAHMRRMKALGG